jgi:hypothetical protein
MADKRGSRMFPGSGRGEGRTDHRRFPGVTAETVKPKGKPPGRRTLVPVRLVLRVLAAAAALGALLALLLGPITAWALGPEFGRIPPADVAAVAAVAVARNTVRQTVLGATAGAGVAVGLIFTGLSYRLSRRGQVTDRYVRAVALLASETLAERVGAVYALEHVMVESPVDHDTIVDVLAAFIRDRAPLTANSAPVGPVGQVVSARDEQKRPPADVRAALTVLVRRPHRPERQPLDLSHTDLSGGNLGTAQLQGADLSGVNLSHASIGFAHLEDANLKKADLTHAVVAGAHLEDANLREADLTLALLEGAHLQRAILQSAVLRSALAADADMRDAHLERADLQGADMHGVDLRGAYMDSQNLENAGFGADTSGARVPPGGTWHGEPLLTEAEVVERYSRLSSFREDRHDGLFGFSETSPFGTAQPTADTDPPADTEPSV